MTRKFTFFILAMLFAILGSGAEAWGQTESVTYVFNSKDWKAKIGNTDANWTSQKDGNQFTANQGIQVTVGASGACGNSNVSYSNVSKITVTYCTNASKGNGTISWYNVESTTAAAQSGNLVGSQSISAPSSGGTTLRTFDIIPESLQSGYIQLYVECSTNSIYIWSIEIQYDSTPSTDPVINADDVELAYDATYGEITYSITNPNPEASFRVETFASWISNLNIIDNKVTFDTEVNTTATSRTATFTLNYTGADDKVVTVTQAGDPSMISYAIDFESDESAYTAWEFTNMESQHDEDIDAYEGAYFGTTGGKATASITTKNKVATPGTLTCWVSKTSNNTTESTWKIQVSSDESTWTDVKTQDATSMNKGEWVEFSADLSNYTDVYVRVCYSGSTAKRAIDALDITKPSSVATPTFSPAAGTYYEAQTVEISCANEDAIILYTLDGSTPTIGSNLYLFPIEIDETTTVKAFAYVDSEVSNVATAKYTIIPLPTYASLAELIDDGEPTTQGTQVNVTLTNETITKFYTNSGGYRNGIFLQVGEQEIEIYCHDVPEEWVIGGKVSGKLVNCTWKLYDDTWELCPNSWDALTYSAPQLYTIGFDIYPSEYGSAETSPASEAAAGTEVTITATPAAHYHVSEIRVFDTDYNVIKVDDNGKFTMPASNVVVFVFFEEDPLCFISYYCNSQIEYVTDWIHAGPIGELREPYESFIPEGFSFAGWSTSMASTTPIDETFNVTEAPTNLYAIFARVEGGSGATTWNLVTDASQISAGDIIKIAATASGANDPDNNGTFAADGIISSSIMGKVNASINNNQLTDEGAAEFTIGGTASEWTLSNGNGELLGATAAKKIAWGGGTTTWTISINNVAEASISNTGTGCGTILYNRDNPRFTTYTSDPNVAMVLPQIFVKTISTVTHYYTRVFQDEYVMDDITIEGPSIITAGSTLNMDDYTLTNTDPANLIIEDGAQLIHHNAGVTATVKKNITGYGEDNEQTTDGYYLIANPTARVANDEYDALEGASSGIDVYTFDPTEELEWRNQAGTASRIPFTRTVGYLFASAEDRTMSFRGSLLPAGEATIDDLKYYDGNEAGHEFPGFNLIGNPFACNAYVQNYSFYTIEGDAVVAGTGAIAPCQGFMIETDEDKVAVELTTQAPEPAAAPSTMSIEVNQNRGNVIDRAIVRFDGANDMHKFMLNPDRTNIRLAKNGEEFAAISTEAEGELPVNFKAEKNGTYTISVNTENVEANYLHLIDNMTGMDTDLLSTPSYTFDAKTSDYASRFKLVFGMKDDAQEGSVSNSFAYISNGEIVISNEGRATLQVIDVLGRIVSSEEINGEARISTNGLTAGVYVLNLNGNVQKIVVR